MVSKSRPMATLPAAITPSYEQRLSRWLSQGWQCKFQLGFGVWRMLLDPSWNDDLLDFGQIEDSYQCGRISC